MRAAGVRLAGGRVIWVDARELSVSPSDEARVLLPEGIVVGTVFVAPNQLVTPPPVEGTMLDVDPVRRDSDDCMFVPGADLPPLGTRVQIDKMSCLVVAINAVEGQVTVRNDDGSEQGISASDLLSAT